MDSTAFKKNKSDKYHRILEAAIKVFAEQGFFRSTVSQIAKEAGVADGTIYLYFKNKDDILLQFFNYKTKLVFSQFRVEVNKAENARDKLKNLIHRHLTEFQRDRNMAIVFQAEARQSSDFEKYIKELTKMYYDLVGEIIKQGQEEGSIRNNLYLGIVKRYILGAVDEVINTWVKAGGDYNLSTATDQLIDLFFNGIGDNRIHKEV